MLYVSFGRALRSQRRGRGFESLHLHHLILIRTRSAVSRAGSLFGNIEAREAVLYSLFKFVANIMIRAVSGSLTLCGLPTEKLRLSNVHLK